MGSTGGMSLNAPLVGIQPTSSRRLNTVRL